MIESKEIERLLREAFPDATLALTDLRGDGEHYELEISSKAFENKPRIDQQRLVFEALQGRVGGVIRGLTLTTKAPSEIQAENR